MEEIEGQDRIQIVENYVKQIYKLDSASLLAATWNYIP